ncbi:hypothetical protein SOVF_134760 [Spinacia oleracea]|nr:hypothetical protein SOVF_134760 [Spinacia oleracea]
MSCDAQRLCILVHNCTVPCNQNYDLNFFITQRTQSTCIPVGDTALNSLKDGTCCCGSICCQY